MVHARPKSKLLTINAFHWVYLTIFVLIVVPFTVANLHCQELFQVYVRTSIAPSIERQFGFKMERRRMFYRNVQPLSVFVIKGLEPDGVLAKLGVRDCDVPVGFFHMSDVAFYRQLEKSGSNTVEIGFINCNEYERTLASGDLFIIDRVHKIVLPTD